VAEQDRLEARLADLAGAVAWPPAPDPRAAVRARIARSRLRRRLVLLAAAVLVLALAAGSAAAVSVELRGAVLHWVPLLPPPPPSGSPGQPAGARLDLGERYPSLEAAERAAGFHAVVPSALGQPDEVWYRSTPGVITLLYRPRRGLPAGSDPAVGALVMEARASVDRPSFGKLLDERTRVQAVTVNGGPGFWISGAGHGVFFYGTPGGGTDTFRLAGDVLIWNQAGLVVRIESSLGQAGALRVAGTVR
jgi:hypothetical protein